MNLKSLLLGALDTVRDESDKSSPVRLVLEPRSSRQDPDEFMQLLLAHTRLEASLPVNLVMLGRDGRPRSKDLRRSSTSGSPSASRRSRGGPRTGWARSTGASTSSKAA